MLAAKIECPVDGFIVEAPVAGGHNAPPRGRPQLSETGEPSTENGTFRTWLPSGPRTSLLVGGRATTTQTRSVKHWNWEPPESRSARPSPTARSRDSTPM
jgi:hypothetical protein